MLERSTPLWPAGHLPLKGGDNALQTCHAFFKTSEWPRAAKRLISPLEGEMAGRPEGGRAGPLPVQTDMPPVASRCLPQLAG